MLWDLYVTHLQAKGCAESTIEGYREDWERFTDWCWKEGLRNYGQVTPNHIRAFLIHLQGRIKPSTIQGYYRTLKALFRWAVNDDLIPKSPLYGIPMPRAALEPINTYTPDEMHAILAHTRSERDFALLLLLYDTGLRLSEAANLTWSNVDLKGRTATVTGKGSKKRTVPFGNTARDTLELWAIRRNGNPLVFPSRHKKGKAALTKSGVNTMLRKVCLRAGVPLRKELVHSIRHTAACNLLEATNGDIMYVKRVLGHSSITTTMRYVEHLENRRVLAKARTFDSPADRL